MTIDWITCTVKEGSPAVTEWIKSGLTRPWQGRDHAAGRYTRTMRCGGVSILMDAPNDESIQLSITGQGCREIEQAGLSEGWADVLARLLRAGASFSRLDAFIDDRDGVLNMTEIIDCCHSGRVVCPYGASLVSEAVDKITGATTGRMVSFGKRGSETSVRLYDKALEQGVPGPWTRVELQSRGTRAQALAEAIAEEGVEVVPLILKGCLDFKGCRTTDRRNRWPTAAWWTQFLGTAQRFRLESAPRDATIEKAYYWFFRQCARLFVMIHDSGLYPTFVADLLEAGRLKCNGKPAKTTRKQQATA